MTKEPGLTGFPHINIVRMRYLGDWTVHVYVSLIRGRGDGTMQMSVNHIQGM